VYQIKLLVQPEFLQSVSHLVAQIVVFKLKCKQNNQFQLILTLNILAFYDLKHTSTKTGFVVPRTQADKVLFNLWNFVQIAFCNLGADCLKQVKMLCHISLTLFQFRERLN